MKIADLSVSDGRIRISWYIDPITITDAGWDELFIMIR